MAKNCENHSIAQRDIWLKRERELLTVHTLDFYPFHIKPIMRSQRRFENNAVWCERSESALFDTGVKKGAFYVGGLLLPREVFWKRILAKSRSLRRCGCQCERVHRIMRREKAKQCIEVMMSFCSILLRFFKPHFPKCGDPMLDVKANRSALEYSSSKADELKVEFSAEWLRIWRYERGICSCTVIP